MNALPVPSIRQILQLYGVKALKQVLCIKHACV